MKRTPSKNYILLLNYIIVIILACFLLNKENIDGYFWDDPSNLLGTETRSNTIFKAICSFFHNNALICQKQFFASFMII